jgi:hypothetical protein
MTTEVSVAERAAFSSTDFVVRYGVVLVGILIAVVFSLLIPVSPRRPLRCPSCRPRPWRRSPRWA